MTAPAPSWLSLHHPLALLPGEEPARPGERVCPGRRTIDGLLWCCTRERGHAGRCVAFGATRAIAAWLSVAER